MSIVLGISLLLFFIASVVALLEPFTAIVSPFVPFVPWMILGGSISFTFGTIRNLLIALIVGLVMSIAILSWYWCSIDAWCWGF